MAAQSDAAGCGRDELRIYLVDDDPVSCQWYQQALTPCGWTVEVFHSAEAFLSQPTISQPCCLLLDLLLPGISGLELCRWAAGKLPGHACVMVSGEADMDAVVGALKHGAIDFLAKPVTAHKLLAAVQQAVQTASRRWQEYQEEENVEECLNSLSPREREVFDYLAQGCLTKQIAARLGISRKTVDVHRSRIMQKLRIDSPTQLAHMLAVHWRRQNRGHRY